MESTALPNARLGALATAVPEHVLNQEDVMRGAAKLFQGSFHDFDRLIPVFKNAAIGTRHSCVPIDWYLQEHSFAERNALFVENAVDLLEKAVVRCLEGAGLAIDRLTPWWSPRPRESPRPAWMRCWSNDWRCAVTYSACRSSASAAPAA